MNDHQRTEAVIRAWGRLGPERVKVIVDADPEVCRLGYGTIEGLKALSEAAERHGIVLSHQPGTRVGLLIADEVTCVFSPTPQLVESSAGAPDHPNAVCLPTTPSALEREVGLGPAGVTDQLVGLDAVPARAIERIDQNLKDRPAVRFDLSRQVRVFSSFFQFVELEMPGCRLSARQARIPTELMGLAGDEKTRGNLRARFRLIGDAAPSCKVSRKTSTGAVVEVELSEQTLAEKRRQIVETYLVHLPRYGHVVKLQDRARFEEAVEDLRRDVEDFSQGAEKQLESLLESNARAIAEMLLPAACANPPKGLVSLFDNQPSEARVRDYLLEAIRAELGSAARLTGRMDVTLVYKNVAYESLQDEEFIRMVRRQMPDMQDLHREFDAVCGRPAEDPE